MSYNTPAQRRADAQGARWFPVAIAAAEHMTGAEPGTVLSRQRFAEVAEARALVAYMGRASGMSYCAIGRLLRRHHSTVWTAVHTVEARDDLVEKAVTLAQQVRAGKVAA